MATPAAPQLFAKKVAQAPLDPEDAAWAEATPVNVALSPQTMTTPTGGGGVAQVELRALHSVTEFAVRLTWQNATDENVVGVKHFRDACAVMFPALPGPPPSPLMGGTGLPVIIWQWKPDWEDPAAAATARDALYPNYSDFYNPDNDSENAKFGDRPGPTDKADVIVAEGFGSVTRVGDSDLEVKSARSGNFTRVVFRRPLPAPSPPLVPGEPWSINVAVWDGASGERGSRKSVSMVWTEFLLEGVPQQPHAQPIAPLLPAPILIMGMLTVGAWVLYRQGVVAADEARRREMERGKRGEGEA